MGFLFGIFGVVFVSILIGSIFSYFKNKKFKETIVKDVLESTFDNVHYTTTQGIDKRRIYDTKLVNSGNSYASSDYLRARYHDLDFEFSNVEVKDSYTVNDQTHTDTYFIGQWIIIKPKIKLSSKLYIIDKEFHFSTPHKPVFFAKTDLEKIELESIGFNKEYKIYTNDAQAAFKVLSPQKILELYEKHHENVSFYLNEQELHIAIYSNKFIFQDKLFSSETQANQEARVKNEILKVLNYIQLLD